MTTQPTPTALAQDLFNIQRVFNAPRHLVFKAWSEAEALKHWWGPKGCVLDIKTFDFCQDGIFHYLMTSKEFSMWGKFVYREISSSERIVYVSSFSNETGETTRGPFHKHWPLEILNTLTLTEEDGKTTLILDCVPINASQEEQETFKSMNASMQQGFNGTFEQLDTYLTIH